MRFECDRCHAKYKISDEKVRGRVVRFPCRKCNHKILIDGRLGDPDVTVPAGAAYGFEEVARTSEPVAPFKHEAPTTRQRRTSSPVRRRPPSVPPRRPSAQSRRLSSVPAAASSAFVGQHPGLAPPVPVATGPAVRKSGVPEWHVSINDVPVGPVHLEEMGHKIDAGAVSEYSLVWREGFEEWRPLATVPALMALLHERRHSGPPPRSAFSSMPPFIDSHSPVEDSVAFAATVAAAEARPSAGMAMGMEFASLADSLQPEGSDPDIFGEMSQPPAPIGPSNVFDSSPQLGSFSGFPAGPDETVSVPSAPPKAALASVEPRRGWSLGFLAVLIAVTVFSAVVAFLAFERYGDSLLRDLLEGGEPRAVSAPSIPPTKAARHVEKPASQTDSAAEAQPLAAAESDQVAEANAGEAIEAGEVVEQEEASPAANVEGDEGKLAIEPPSPRDDGPKIEPTPRPKARVERRAAPKREPVVATTAPAVDSASDAEQKVLAEFRSNANAAPANIEIEKASSAQSDDPPLDGDGVRATVTENKPRLQRCYERAIRGQQSPPAVRLDVTVTVAPSGRVKNVSAAGSGPGGLAECIEASVRRWRFPASSEGGPAKFPIVFSAN